MYKRIITSIAFLTGMQIAAWCQTIPNIPGVTINRGNKTDTAQKPPALPDPRKLIKPYHEVITAAYTTKKGMFTVHQYKDTFYFEIPATLLLRDIMVINRLVKAPAGTNVFSGEEVSNETIEFQRNPIDSTIRLAHVAAMAIADSGNNINKAVINSYPNSITYVFPIKAYSTDSSSYVIDVSQYMKIPGNLFNSIANQGLNTFLDSRSFKDVLVESVHAYPINVEIVTSKNGLTKPMLPNNQAYPTTMVTNTSFILLPEKPMQHRVYDPRVGYFFDYEYYYSDKQQQVERRDYIHRWRLEPRQEDMKKYKRGELVEPAKPIVIYIDPATPKQWRPYLIAGINDWQKAFEQAGFKNAIMGKEWPEGDTNMHMDDARYSFIRYLPSEQMNAYGPNTYDIRSGEIIQTHIGWYHNVMKLLRNWYFIQASATDPNARKAVFDDELMGNLIRFVSSHEVGHTLGLLHNFGSSSRTPVDSLRSKTYLAKYKHTASIMDYARFNYVAQPEDNIPQSSLFPGIGEYDKWAIEYGYKYTTASFEEDKKAMRQLIVDKTTNNPRLWFGDGETSHLDPRCQTEDLGDNPMKANSYGIKNLQRVMAHLPEWTQEQGGIYTNLKELYEEIKMQYTRYITHVSKFVGGAQQTWRSEQQADAVYEPVPRAIQEEALHFYDEQLFNTPLWLLDSKVTSKVGEPVFPDFVEDIQVKTLNSLFDMVTFNKLLANQRQFSDKALPAETYLAMLHKMIWSELTTGNITSPYRRSLQKSYIGNLQTILLSNVPDNTETDVYSLIRYEIVSLQEEITTALTKTTDTMSRHHLEDILARIKKILDTKQSS